MPWTDHKTTAQAAETITRDNLNWNALDDVGLLGPWKAYLGQPQQVFERTWQTLEDNTLKSLYDHG